MIRCSLINYGGLMPLITGYNISPLSSDNADRIIREDGTLVIPDVKSRDFKYYWRYPLGDLLKKATSKLWGISEENVSCFFPHDPSVPVNPYPIAALIVEFLYYKPVKNLDLRVEYAEYLGKMTKAFLDELRGTKNARIEVAIRPFNPKTNGFYLTPK